MLARGTALGIGSGAILGGGGGAAPTPVNAGAISTDTNSTNATGAVSGTPATNEVVWTELTIVGSAASVITPPSGEGWAVAARRDSDISIAVYWKRWGVGHTDSTAPAFAGTAGNMRAVCGRISGCTTSGNPYYGTAGGGDNDGGSTNLVAPTATGGTNALVMRFFGAGGTAQQVTAPATTLCTGAPYAFAAGTDGACGVSHTTSSSNPTGTATATLGVSVDGGKAAITIAWKP